MKESEAKSKAREENKKAKAEKKAKKKDEDDPKAGVAKDYGHVRRGQVIQFGKGRSLPSGKGSIRHMEQSDTDVPDDDDFLVELDEWSEVEKGRGPMADWTHNNVYDADQGKVVASAPPINNETCGFLFKPPKTNVCHFAILKLLRVILRMVTEIYRSK